MPSNQENNHESWLAKAHEDELSAESILKYKDGAPSTVCFLAQQAAEKLLKALLVYNGHEFLKVHDLIELETALMVVASDIKEVHDNLTLLNRYYIETRYPGDYPEFSWEEAEKALAAATLIKDFVMKKVGN